MTIPGVRPGAPRPEDPDRPLSVMQVAHRLRRRYQKARDLMLSGQLGPSTYDGHRLTVSASGVAAYEARLRAKDVKKKEEKR